MVRTGYFDVFVHANNYLRFDLYTIIIIMFVHVSEMSGSECQDNPLARCEVQILIMVYEGAGLS